MRRAVGVLAAAVCALAALPACGDDDERASRTFSVAFLRAVPSSSSQTLFDELRAAGFTRGDNLRVLPTDEDEIHPMPEDATRAVREWLADGVDLIFAFSSNGATAAAELTSEVPILFLVNDPTAVGLLEDEEAPEGNLTGVTFRVPADRTLDLARQAIPGLATVGVIYPADDPAAAPHRDAVVSAGPPLGVEVVAEPFTDDADVPRALDTLVSAGADAVLVANAPTSVRTLPTIEPAAAERGLPLIANTELVEAAVVVLQPDSAELLAQLGRQAARILHGALPHDVPVENPRHFRVTLNQAAATALGLPDFTPELLRQADTVAP